MDAGEYVPDEVTNADGARPDRRGRTPSQGFLLDGYPRTLAQVDELDGMIEPTGHSLDAVVVLTVDQEELVQRLLRGPRPRAAPTTPRTSSGAARRSTPSRPSRSSRSTASVACSCEVDGMGEVDEVTDRILEALDERPGELSRRPGVPRPRRRDQDAGPDRRDARCRPGRRPRPSTCCAVRSRAGMTTGELDRIAEDTSGPRARAVLPRLRPPAVPGDDLRLGQRRGRARHPRCPGGRATATSSRSTAARSSTAGTATRLSPSRSARCPPRRWS